jgi:hypothetical protein
MATLPGLPMFGHGQIEGFTEKYGMEYRRAYWDEQPDGDLVRRHEREIFPLLRRRHLFAEVGQFFLYDLFTPEGHVNEDVFAYSNGAGGERALVIYHNKYAATRGWIRTSVGYLGRTGNSDQRALMQTDLAAGLGLHRAPDHFCIFRDHVTGLEYIRNNQELSEKGLHVELAAYKYHVFLDFRQVRDNEWHQYAHLSAYLDGRGVPRIDEALKEIFLGPVHQPFKELVSAPTFRQLLASRVHDPTKQPDLAVLGAVERKVVPLLRAMKQLGGGAGDEAAIARQVRQRLEAALELPVLESRFPAPPSSDYQAAVAYLKSRLHDDPRLWTCLFGWVFVHSLGRILDETDYARQSRSWLDEWLLGRLLARALQDLGLQESQAWAAVQLVGLLTTHQCWFPTEGPAELQAYRVLETLLKDSEGQQFLRVNRFQDIQWYTQEALEELVWWLFVVAAVQSSADPRRPAPEVAEEIAGYYRIVRDLQRAGQEAEHRVEKLLEVVKV